MAAIRWRRIFQFGLGTAFIVLTLIGVALSFISQRVLPQQRAVAAIVKAGGQINYDTDNATWARDRVAEWIGNDWCYTVRGVSLEGDCCNEQVISLLRPLRDVRRLSLATWPKAPGERPATIADESMKIVASMPNLERVLLRGRIVSTVGMDYLRKHPQIKEVEVWP